MRLHTAGLTIEELDGALFTLLGYIPGDPPEAAAPASTRYQPAPHPGGGTAAREERAGCCRLPHGLCPAASPGGGEGEGRRERGAAAAI